MFKKKANKDKDKEEEPAAAPAAAPATNYGGQPDVGGKDPHVLCKAFCLSRGLCGLELEGLNLYSSLSSKHRARVTTRRRNRN